MKKSIFILAVALACGFIIIACASDKKSKKSTGGVTVEVTPSDIGEVMASSPTRTLTATVKVNGVVQSSPTVSWIVEPPSLGFCTPNQGESTVFTADTDRMGYGTIVASYNGTASSPVQFSVNKPLESIDSILISPSTTQNITTSDTLSFTATAMAGTTTVSNVKVYWKTTGQVAMSPNPSDSGSWSVLNIFGTGNAVVKATYGSVESTAVNVIISDPAPTANKFVIYNDSGFDSGILTGQMVWTYPSGQEANPCAKMTEIQGGSQVDGATSLQFINNYGAQANNACGWNFVLGSKKDLSSYTKLVFYAKGNTASDKVYIEVGSVYAGDSDNTSASPFQAALTTSWKKYEIDISALNRTAISVLFNLVFAQDKNIPEEMIWIDNIYFEE